MNYELIRKITVSNGQEFRDAHILLDDSDDGHFWYKDLVRGEMRKIDSDADDDIAEALAEGWVVQPDKYKLVVCGNTETILDDYNVGPYEDDIATEMCNAAADVIRESGFADYQTESFFSDWHGGKHHKCGGKVAGETRGYSAGWVVCHERYVPQKVKDLCDNACEAMEKVARQAEETEKTHHADKDG